MVELASEMLVNVFNFQYNITTFIKYIIHPFSLSAPPPKVLRKENFEFDWISLGVWDDWRI